MQVFLKELTHKDYPQTLDPTLLLSKKQWEKLCHPVAEKDYIAVYAVGFEKETIEFARQVARKLNKKLLIIRAYSKHYMSKENKEYCGPDDFLSYIRYSDFVVTTSFHGTAFSIIFNKQFVCPVFNDNTRINSLLTVVDLNARLVRTPEEALSLPSINYDNVDDLLEQERVVSRHFLEVALSCN